jgi:hemerythrin-like domain-containing protein
MDAIDMLVEQHEEVSDLFEQVDAAEQPGAKWVLFEQIADKLAVHATIEERHFYPAVKEKRTEDILLESLEEHLGIKRILADLLALGGPEETFDAKMKFLKETVEHHVEEEHKDLFPKVKKLLDRETLEALAQEMTATQEELLEEGDPRLAIPHETEQPAQI